MDINEQLLYRQLGERIRLKRVNARVTQSQLGEATGLLRTSVTNIEAGRQKAPLHVIYRMCAFLGIEVATVLPEIGVVAEMGNEVVTAPQQLQNTLPRTAAFLQQVIDDSPEGQ